MAKYNTLTALFTAVANALRGKTGGTGAIVADDFPNVIDSLSAGGITPTGTKNITENGTYDVTSFATAQVAVPASGITPSGTKEITTNGTHDVTSFASALVNVATGLNARMFTTTVASDVTSGNFVIAPANDYIASIRSNPNAFVLIWMLDQPAATAMYSMWMVANFNLMYTGNTVKNTIVFRTTTAGNNITLNNTGLTSENKSAGHITVLSDGSLRVYACNTTYPVKAGTYKILAGALEML